MNSGRPISIRALLGVTVLGAALLAAAGCGGRNSRASESRAREEVHALVQRVVKAYGGAVSLGKVRAIRAEGIITGTRHREQGDVVRFFARPDGLREQRRYQDHEELSVLLGEDGWSGGGEGELQPLAGAALDAMRIDAARLDLPLRLAEQESLLVLLEPDEKGRVLLRAPAGGGLLLDVHVNPKSHRIERTSARIPGPSPATFHADLSEFRWVHGVLVPFREDAHVDGVKTAILRFRSVVFNPEIPAGLFTPPEAP